MKLFIVLISVLLLNGCGARVLAPASVDRARVNLANLFQATKPEVKPSAYSQDAMHLIAKDMATTLGITSEELENSWTVRAEEWNGAPEEAAKKVQDSVSKPLPPSNAWWALGGAVAIGIGVTALRTIAASGTGGLPQLAGLLGSLVGWTMHPKDKLIRDKLELAVTKASGEDDGFADSAVGKELSKIMTPEEKTYIKRKKAKKNYDSARKT